MSMQDLITSAAQRYGVDPNLALSVAKAESGLDPNAVSSKGAVGIMQLMPSSFPGVNIADPATNIDTGVGYLAQMMQRYGDVNLALAAYNAGPGNVDKYGGVPPFTETQNYVDKVLAWFGAMGGSSGSGGASDITSGDSAAVDTTQGFDWNNTALVVGLGLAVGLVIMELS